MKNRKNTVVAKYYEQMILLIHNYIEERFNDYPGLDDMTFDYVKELEILIDDHRKLSKIKKNNKS